MIKVMLYLLCNSYNELTSTIDESLWLNPLVF